MQIKIVVDVDVAVVVIQRGFEVTVAVLQRTVTECLDTVLSLF